MTLRDFTPPVMIRLYLNYLNTRYGFHGHYASWEEAREASHGYDSELILKKVRESCLKVKRGEAAYECDSVLYPKIAYSWPILAALLRIASMNNNRLKVLDFGGSLGSTYYQNRHFLASLSQLKWCVVEQEAFVDCGKADFENQHLRFYYDFESCMSEEQIDVVLLSSVLPYLREPYEILNTVASSNVSHLIIDRHPLLPSSPEDRLTVQKVRPSTYSASYPAWFFSKEKFLLFVRKHYRIVALFDCSIWSNIKSEFKGFILEKH